MVTRIGAGRPAGRSFTSYIPEKNMWRMRQPPPDFLVREPIRSREKEYLYEMRLAQDRRGQDALAGQGASAGETPRGRPWRRPFSISTDPPVLGPRVRALCLNQE
jgi:hypothetical protein